MFPRPTVQSNHIRSGSLGPQTSKRHPLVSTCANLTFHPTLIYCPCKDITSTSDPAPEPKSHTETSEKHNTREKRGGTMSQAYERESQNNSRLDELASKVSALRGVTINIYDNARDQHVIDSTVCPSFPLLHLPSPYHSPSHPPSPSNSTHLPTQQPCAIAEIWCIT
jgi:hypothetical protein